MKPAATIRKALLASALLFVMVHFAFSNPLADFIEYWTAAHLFLAGQNPYSLVDMRHLQQALGWRGDVPLMFLCPPWALPLIAPLGLFHSYPIAWLLWVGVLVTAIIVAARWLFLLYGANQRPPWYGVALAFLFLPTLACLKFTQVVPFSLLGVAGFLWFNDRKRPILAGLFLAMTAVKPHLVYLVWLAVLLDSCRQKKWKSFVSAVSALAILTISAVIVSRSALTGYWQLSTGPYIAIYPSALGALLRYLPTLRAAIWPQFIPAVGGVAWLLFRWHKKGRDWHWREQMPVVLTASVATAAYGWLFDQSILVVVLIVLACRHLQDGREIPRFAIVLYAVLNGCLIVALVLAARGIYLAFALTYVITPVTAWIALEKGSVQLTLSTSTLLRRLQSEPQ